MRRGLVPKGLKVAQPRKRSGLGNEAKEDVRPARDDRNVELLVYRIRVPERERPSIVPSGTGRFF